MPNEPAPTAPIESANSQAAKMFNAPTNALNKVEDRMAAAPPPAATPQDEANTQKYTAQANSVDNNQETTTPPPANSFNLDASPLVSPNKYPLLNQQPEVLNPDYQYGGSFSYLWDALKQSGETIKNVSHQWGLAGLKPYSQQQLQQAQAEQQALNVKMGSIPTLDKLPFFIPAMLASPEAALATGAAKLADVGLNVAARLAIKMGGRVTGGIVNRALEYKPISYGVNGLGSGTGWTIPAQLNSEALHEKFDMSEYATNAIVFGMMGTAIGGLIHEDVGAGLADGILKGSAAIKKGVTPIVNAVSTHAWFQKAFRKVGDEVATGVKDPTSPIDDTDWTNLDGEMEDNLKAHNEARKDLGLRAVKNPKTKMQMNLAPKITDVTDDDIKSQAGISSTKYQGTEFEDPIDAAAYRAANTDSKLVRKKLMTNLKSMTGATFKEITEHADDLKIIAQGFKNKVIPTVSTDTIDHVKPRIDAKYNDHMMSRNETPYAPKYRQIEERLPPIQSELSNLRDKNYANKLSGANRKRFDALNKLQDNLDRARPFYEEQETNVLKGLNKGNPERAAAIQKVDSTAMQHSVLKAKKGFKDLALNSADEPLPKVTEEDTKMLNNEPVDSDDQLRMQAAALDDPESPFKDDMEAQIKQLKDTEGIDLKGVAADLSDIDDEITKTAKLKQWFRDLTNCLINEPQ